MDACYLDNAIVVTSLSSVSILELHETISWCRLQLGSFPYEPKLVAVGACFECLCTMPLLDI
jgi:hypothetical protein